MQKLIIAVNIFFSVFLFAAGGRELITGGDFEQAYKQSLHIRRLLRDSEGKVIPHPEGAIRDRVQNEKVFAGQKALLLEAEVGGHEINSNRDVLTLLEGARYEFSFRYFIASAAPQSKVSARVTFAMADGGYKYLFPNGDTTPGKWHQLKVEFYPPAGTERMSVTLWFSNGPYKIYVDEISVIANTDTPTVNLAAQAGILVDSPEFTLWKQANFRRVESSGVPNDTPAISAVELKLAANEREPFQLVLTAKQDLSQLSLRFSDLIGEHGRIPAALQDYGILKFVPMRNPDNPTLRGELADPIVPAAPVDAKPDKNTIFYVKMFVPAETVAGEYKGSVILLVAGKVVAEVPIALTVRNFSLPDSPQLRTFFYGNVWQIKRAYKDGRSSQEIADDVSELLRDHRINGNQCVKPGAPKHSIVEDTLTVTDWSEFDAFIFRQWEKFGICNFTVPILGMMGDNGGWFGKEDRKLFGAPLFSERARNLAGQYARQFDEHWRKTFPPQLRYYSYIYDEPPAKVYEELNRLTGEIKRQAPNFRFFVPHTVDPDLPDVTVFVVPFGFGYVKPELQRGREIWYYNWPHPLDHHNYIKNRLYAWQIYANDGEGGLTWQMTSTPGPEVDPWNNLEKTYRNGHNTTIFPALTSGGRLVPTMRLAQVRESIDDFDYLKLLESKVDTHFPGHGKARVAELLKELMPELPFEFVNDSNLLYGLRNKIADEIEDFDRQPVALAISMPEENTATELSSVSFTILAPENSTVSVDGSQVGVVHSGRLEFVHELSRLGENRVAISIEHAGRKRIMTRCFILKRDANLQKLELLAKQLEELNLPAIAEKSFLEAHAAGKYTPSHRAQCSQLLAAAEKRLIAARLGKSPSAGNPLLEAVWKQAQWMYDQGIYTRAAYYLDMAGGFASYQLATNGQLSIEPVSLEGNFGFRIGNGMIEFTLLELGGRIVSFKVAGKETLHCGDLSKTLPLALRAGKQYQQFTHLNLPSIGGYEDAGLELLPESSVDWDLSVKELSNQRIALQASMLMRGDKFRIERVMSIVPGSMELKIDYTISNVFPAEFVSDDPSHYQFNWRGRMVPAIGENRQGDTLEVPTDMSLPATVFDSAKPVFYELRSIPLSENYLAVFNAEKQAGFTWRLDPQINYAYIWMNSKGDHQGKNKLYTMEVFRSFYANKPGVAGNRPFDIKPGEAVSFSLALIGRTK